MSAQKRSASIMDEFYDECSHFGAHAKRPRTDGQKQSLIRAREVRAAKCAERRAEKQKQLEARMDAEDEIFDRPLEEDVIPTTPECDRRPVRVPNAPARPKRDAVTRRRLFDDAPSLSRPALRRPAQQDVLNATNMMLNSAVHQLSARIEVLEEHSRVMYRNILSLQEAVIRSLSEKN